MYICNEILVNNIFNQARGTFRITTWRVYRTYLLKMEKIINNPGLQHLAEKVFSNLELKDLEVCAMINQLSKQILDNPIFWLKKFVSRGMSKKNETEWAKAIKSGIKYNKKKQIILYMKWHMRTPQEKVDFPFRSGEFFKFCCLKEIH